MLGLSQYIIVFLQQMESYSDTMHWNIVEGSHKITLTLTWNFRKASTSAAGDIVASAPVTAPESRSRGLWRKLQKVLHTGRSGSTDDDSLRHSLRTAASVPEKISRFLQSTSTKHAYGCVKHAHSSPLGFWPTSCATKRAFSTSISDRELVTSTAATASAQSHAVTPDNVPWRLRQQQSEDSLLCDSSLTSTVHTAPHSPSTLPPPPHPYHTRDTCLSADNRESWQQQSRHSSLAARHWATVRTLSFGEGGIVQALHTGGRSRPWRSEHDRDDSSDLTKSTPDPRHLATSSLRTHASDYRRQDDISLTHLNKPPPLFNTNNTTSHNTLSNTPLNTLSLSPSHATYKTRDQLAATFERILEASRQRTQMALNGSVHQDWGEEGKKSWGEVGGRSGTERMTPGSHTVENLVWLTDDDEDDTWTDKTDSEVENNVQIVCDTLQRCFETCDNILDGHPPDDVFLTSTDIF